MASTDVHHRDFVVRDDEPASPTAQEQQQRRPSDPFALNRDPFDSPNDARRGSNGSDQFDGQDPMPLARRDRRLSKEWDAAMTPPSRFQKVEGSIYATPASRDGHVARNKIHGFKEKVRELGGVKK